MRGARFWSCLLGSVVVAAGACWDYSVSAQSTGSEVLPREGGQLGTAVLGVGDQDGDGIEDLAVSIMSSRSGGRGAELYKPPEVMVLSGSSWRILWRSTGEVGSGFGKTMSCPGDLDGDGCPDLVIGAPGGAGRVTAFSCRSSKPLWSVDGRPLSGLGGSLAATISPVDGKTRGVIAGAQGYQKAGIGTVGLVVMLSGKDGSEKWKVEGSVSEQLFGQDVTSVGDFDNDGTEDVAVSAPWRSLSRRDAPEPIRIFSVASGMNVGELSLPKGAWSGGWELHGFPSVSPKSSCALYATVEWRDEKDPTIRRSGLVAFTGARMVNCAVVSSSSLLDAVGVALVPCGDIDGDGAQDLIVGVPRSGEDKGQFRGAVRALSGKDGRVIWDSAGRHEDGRFGYSLAILGPATPQGAQRVIAGIPGAESDGRRGAGLLAVMDLRGKVLREVGNNK